MSLYPTETKSYYFTILYTIGLSECTNQFNLIEPKFHLVLAITFKNSRIIDPSIDKYRESNGTFSTQTNNFISKLILSL
jgi:hypothetical protein